tara:strand:- start:12068 stop:12280 length:213 start_codon:yes stop_codon:yes gene_type:complete
LLLAFFCIFRLNNHKRKAVKGNTINEITIRKEAKKKLINMAKAMLIANSILLLVDIFGIAPSVFLLNVLN